MIIRIVKMSFRDDARQEFKEFFESRKSTIRAFEGCTHLELWEDKNDPCTFFTYSTWDSEEHLHEYRNSDFFTETWTKTKTLFAAKPAAWTVMKM